VWNRFLRAKVKKRVKEKKFQNVSCFMAKPRILNLRFTNVQAQIPKVQATQGFYK